jgi:hypothetical protein
VGQVRRSASRPLLVVWRSAALDPESGLTLKARLAACVYCEYSSASGALDPAPSAATVAQRMNAAERTARAARAELEAAGWLTVERRSGHPSRMQLLLAEPRQDLPGYPGSSRRGTPANTPANTPATDATELDNKRTRGRTPPPDEDFSAVLARVEAAGRGEEA